MGPSGSARQAVQTNPHALPVLGARMMLLIGEQVRRANAFVEREERAFRAQGSQDAFR